jgi:hypothetical protein
MKAIQFSLCKPPLNDNVFPLHVPKLAQTLPQGLDASCDSGREGSALVPYPVDFLRLLRPQTSRQKDGGQQADKDEDLTNASPG